MINENHRAKELAVSEVPRLQVICGERRSGRTDRLLQWLSEGHEIDPYPGWSRVLVCHSREEAERLRNREMRDDPRFVGLDYYRMVWMPDELRDLRRCHAVIEYAVDNLELWLNHLVPVNARLAAVTFDGEAEQLPGPPPGGWPSPGERWKAAADSLRGRNA